MSIVAVAASLGGVVTVASSATGPQYTEAATKRCLARTSLVGPVRPADSRMRAFRDLAQHNSFQAKMKYGVVALAFSKTPSQAKLLAELLAVPKNPYRVIIRSNVVLMFRRPALKAFNIAASCLRS